MGIGDVGLTLQRAKIFADFESSVLKLLPVRFSGTDRAVQKMVLVLFTGVKAKR